MRKVSLLVRQAEVLGQQWAESVCRGELRALDAWPDMPKAWDIARRKVATLPACMGVVELDPGDHLDPEELADACMRGAAAWWARRPARYRR